MTTDTAAKRDTQKLQRAIVDGLEDVKAQDIQVFDTEHLSSLFERVIVASGTSNRQTKALAASVRDAVREAGFPKPRIEGEANGEWIIVDCAQAVVHIMQPTFRSYYHLEELWGEKPVRLKFGATRPVPKATPEKAAPASRKAAAKKGAAKTASASGKTPARKSGASRAAGSVAPARSSAPVLAKAPVKAAVRKGTPAKAAAKTAAPAKTAARKTPARKKA
jgi:ribosome-associated protein